MPKCHVKFLETASLLGKSDVNGLLYVLGDSLFIIVKYT